MRALRASLAICVAAFATFGLVPGTGAAEVSVGPVNPEHPPEVPDVPSWNQTAYDASERLRNTTGRCVPYELPYPFDPMSCDQETPGVLPELGPSPLSPSPGETQS